MSKNLRGWIVWLVVTLAAVGVLFFLGLWVNSYLDPFDDRPFDQAAWAAAEEHEHNRLPMARDAIHQIPPGTPKERVRELLGDAESIPANGDRWGMKPSRSETWSYSLGGWYELGPYQMDAAFLYVHFDADGRVVSAEINGG